MTNQLNRKQPPQFSYGGQAVIEGVMMRGAHKVAVAVRNPKGEIVVHEEALNATLYRGWVFTVSIQTESVIFNRQTPGICYSATAAT